MDSFNKHFKSWTDVIGKNDYVNMALYILLIVYASFAAPRLPEYIAKLFDNVFFKLFIFFLIAYSAKQNAIVAIIASIGVMISLQTLARINFNKDITQKVQEETQKRAAEMESEMEKKKNEHMESIERARQEQEAEHPHMGEFDSPFMESHPEQHLQETHDPVAPKPHPEPCGTTANFRNSFYPQYVNMKQDAYTARHTDEGVVGYDTVQSYSSV